MLDGTSFGTFLPGLLLCLFCLNAGPTSKLATNFRFRPSIILVVSEIIEFKTCLAGMGHICSIQ